MGRALFLCIVMLCVLTATCVAEEVPALNLEAVGSYGGGFGKSFTTGWEFEVTRAITVTQLGVFDKDGKGLSQKIPVAIWRLSGEEIVRGVVPEGDAGALAGRCRFAAIEPVKLKPGRYFIGALYTPRSQEGVVSSNAGVAFTSMSAIDWLGSRRGFSEELALPRAPEASDHYSKLPGSFGPNFQLLADEDQEARPNIYYSTRVVQPPVRYETISTPEKPDGSHRDERPTTICLFATADGRLTQVVVDGVPLGTGDEAFRKLAEEVKQRNRATKNGRPLVQVAFTASVKASDVRWAMHAAHWFRFDRKSHPNIGRGCDLLSLYEARDPQRSKDGRFVAPDRFRDAGDYIEDRWTGLLWQKDGDDSGRLNFYQAADYAKDLKLGGMAGWRVPTRDEYITVFPATFAPFKDTHYNANQCCASGEEFPAYWTSELDGPPERDYAFIYQWYATGGGNNCFASSNYGYVRCVHDPIAGSRE